MTTNSPAEKPLRTTSFIIHATRGVIRDPNMRRKTMFALVIVALLLLFFGSTVLQSTLNQREHPFWFIFFWLICAWVTVTAMLLAIFDMLMVKLETRRARRQLRENLKVEAPTSTTDK